MKKILTIGLVMLGTLVYSQNTTVNSIIFNDRTTTERDAYSKTANKVRLIYNETTGQFEYVVGTGSWTAFQAGSITDGDYGDISISSGVWSIDQNAVGTDELAANAVTNAKIVDNAISQAEMNDDAIGTAELDDGADTPTAGQIVAVATGAADFEYIDASSVGSTLPVSDATSIVEGSSDATKEVRIEVDGLTTATTRVITMADADVDLGLIHEVVGNINEKKWVTISSATVTAANTNFVPATPDRGKKIHNEITVNSTITLDGTVTEEAVQALFEAESGVTAELVPGTGFSFVGTALDSSGDEVALGSNQKVVLSALDYAIVSKRSSTQYEIYSDGEAQSNLLQIEDMSGVVSFYDDTTIDATATAEDDPVNSWNDRVGSNNGSTGAAGIFHIGTAGSSRQVEFASDWFDCGTATDTNFVPGTDEFAFVIRIGDTAPSTGTIVSKAAGTSGSRRFQIFSNSGSIRANIGGTETANGNAIGANELIIVNVTTSGVTIYQDGTVTINNASIGTSTDTANLNIGSRTSGSFNLTGMLDMVAIFDRVLTAQEITDLGTAYQVN